MWRMDAPIFAGRMQDQMQELLRTNDIVLLSYLQHRLQEAGLVFFLVDSHMSVMEGSLGLLPRRLLVAEEDMGAAKAILADVRREQQRDGSDEHPIA